MVYEQDPVWWRRREAHFLWVPLGFVLALCLNLGTASASFTDTTVSDFGAGTTGPDTHVSETGNGAGNGEVILKPTVLERRPRAWGRQRHRLGRKVRLMK